jgi:trans-2,3-dihydro-3-hydroxyanthranilate isomerase
MLDYFVVDVFTTEAYAGNPLAVVPDADGLSDGDLQRIANEFNLSETAFPMAATVEGASYRLRIFTPTTELPFAGHPSVGAAWVMRSLGRVGDGEVIQECGAGLLPLQLDGDRVTLSGGEPSVSEPVDPAPVLAAVGLAATDFVGDAVRWAGAGLNWGFVHVHPDAVARARPDTAALDAVAAGTVLSGFSYDDGVAHARVFAGGAGVPEDPATGSAALGFGVWLAATGLVLADGVTSYLIEQGVEIGRPSRLECTVRCVDGHPVELAVAGAVVPIAEGRIRVP